MKYQYQENVNQMKCKHKSIVNQTKWKSIQNVNRMKCKCL